MMRKILLLAIVGLASTVWADTVVTYNAKTYKDMSGLPSSTNRKVDIWYNTFGGVTNILYLYCTPTNGETIVLKGDPLKFCATNANSYIFMQGHGTLVIENDVIKDTGSNKGTQIKPNKLPDVPTNTYSGALIANSGVGTKVFENLSLEDNDPVAATQSAAALPVAAEMDVSGLYRGYDEDGRLFKQFQYQCGETETSGKYLYRVIKVQLTQVGEDIYARFISAYDIRCGFDGSGNPSIPAGFDVDEYLVGLTSQTAESADGYGVDKITLVRTKLPTVRFTGNVTLKSGSDYIEALNGIRIEYANRSWIGPSQSKFTGTLKADAKSETAISGFTVKDNSSYVSGRLSNSGTFSFLGEDPDYTHNYARPSAMPKGDDPYMIVPIATNYEEVVLTGADGAMLSKVGDQTDYDFFPQGSEPTAATMYYLREVTDINQIKNADSKRYRMQFQAERESRDTPGKTYVLCAYLDVEVNTNTYEVSTCEPRLPTSSAKTEYRGNAFTVVKDEASGKKLGMDFDNYIYGKGADQYWTSSSFRICTGLKLYFASKNTGESALYFSWTDLLQMRPSGTICVRGTTNHYPVFKTSNTTGLLTNHVFEIGPYGAMDLNKYHITPENQDRNFDIYHGGELRLNSNMSLVSHNSAWKAKVIGGTLKIGIGASADAYDCGGYLFQRIMLKNGANITGTPMRIGNQQSTSYVRVAGEQPSTISSGLCIAGQGKAGTVCDGWDFTFAVADVTGDDEADLVINGPVKHYAAASWTPGTVPIYKKGAGTVLFNVPTQFNVNHPISIDNGTWMFGASNVAQSELKLKLNGGAIAAAADTTNSAGALILAANSSMVLEKGATLSFADSSGETWASDAILNVTMPIDSASGELAATLKFGNSSHGARMSRVRINGGRAHLDAEGKVVLGAAGVVILVW